MKREEKDLPGQMPEDAIKGSTAAVQSPPPTIGSWTSCFGGEILMGSIKHVRTNSAAQDVEPACTRTPPTLEFHFLGRPCGEAKALSARWLSEMYQGKIKCCVEQRRSHSCTGYRSMSRPCFGPAPPLRALPMHQVVVAGQGRKSKIDAKATS